MSLSLTNPEIALPPLDLPCPNCTTEDAQKQMAAEYEKWVNEELAAYEAFTATYKYSWGAAEAWKETAAYRELKYREPLPPNVGCVECGYTKRVLTDAGRQVLDFVRRWAK